LFVVVVILSRVVVAEKLQERAETIKQETININKKRQASSRQNS